MRCDRGVAAARPRSAAGSFSSVVGQVALISSLKVAENSRLCFSWRHQREDLLDVVDEAHVEHAVGFVEHEDLDVAQVERALLLQVEQAAGGGDQDVDAAA